MGQVKFYENGNIIRAIAAPLIITAYDDKPYIDWEYGVFNKQCVRIYYKDIVNISYFKGGIVKDAYFAISTYGRTYHAKLVGDFQNIDVLANALENCREIQRNQEANPYTNTNTTANNISNSGADEILKYKNLLDQGILTQEEFDAKKKQILGL